MTDVLEKIGILYALQDCRNRNCNNCVALEMCRKQIQQKRRFSSIEYQKKSVP